MKSEILLHVCCAPDATTAVERLEPNFKTICFFANSNIQPLEEYLKRKEALEILINHYDSDIIYGDYNPEAWIAQMKGLESEREGGSRCKKCIYINLFETALSAKCNHIQFFTTTLMTSPHKDVEWIYKAGKSIEKSTGVRYHHEVFRKNNGFLYSVEKSRQLGLYRQKYCGCIFSIYDKDGDRPS